MDRTAVQPEEEHARITAASGAGCTAAELMDNRDENGTRVFSFEEKATPSTKQRNKKRLLNGAGRCVFYLTEDAHVLVEEISREPQFRNNMSAVVEYLIREEAKRRDIRR